MARGQARILLVDDEQAVQTLLTYPLRKEGYEVVSAMDGQAALDRFSEQRFDLVVLDIMLPKLDGIEVCRRLGPAAGGDCCPVELWERDPREPDRSCCSENRSSAGRGDDDDDAAGRGDDDDDAAGRGDDDDDDAAGRGDDDDDLVDHHDDLVDDDDLVNNHDDLVDNHDDLAAVWPVPICHWTGAQYLLLMVDLNGALMHLVQHAPFDFITITGRCPESGQATAAAAAGPDVAALLDHATTTRRQHPPKPRRQPDSDCDDDDCPRHHFGRRVGRVVVAELVDTGRDGNGGGRLADHDELVESDEDTTAAAGEDCCSGPAGRGAALRTG